MNTVFTIIPRFLKSPREFYLSVQRGENLRGKTIALFVSTVSFLAVYGFMTGLSHSWLQAISTGIKMPLLFLLTLAFTLPALYFFALALLNIKFSVAQAGVVVLSGIGVTAFLLLGLSPVTLFFVLTSSNYPFFQLLAVVFVAISGFIGLYYILHGFTWVDKNYELTGGSLGGLLLRAWVLLYGFVGAQMTWRLSPLIGDPQYPFVLLRPSRDNFFVDVAKALQQTLGFNINLTPDLAGTVICGGMMALVALVLGVWLGARAKTSSAKTPPTPVEEAASPESNVKAT
ncbi:MAG: hypothetical protein H5T62_03780 [Anaerolineae bacterium]|nr:hypothetical protein [Anaerolineae bacterium]